MAYFHALIVTLLFVSVTITTLVWQTHSKEIDSLNSQLTAVKREYTLLSAKPAKNITNIVNLSTPSAAEKEVSTNIESALEAFDQRLLAIETAPSPTTHTTIATQQFQRQTLSLGSATTNNTNWTTTPLEITIDKNEYPSSVTARFEAGLNIVGGIASARLINTTTGSTLSITEVSHNSNTTAWATSTTFNLHAGENTYAIELRSSSSEQANLVGARIILDD